MVLFLFTVMLLNLNIEEELNKPFLINLAALITGGLFFLTITGALRGMDISNGNPEITQIGLVKNLGQVLFRDFRLPFEVSSVLFLSAMVGAVMLGKKTGD
jgi:NADH-quinone oxidoreductase subunit J